MTEIGMTENLSKTLIKAANAKVRLVSTVKAQAPTRVETIRRSTWQICISKPSWLGDWSLSPSTNRTRTLYLHFQVNLNFKLCKVFQISRKQWPKTHLKLRITLQPITTRNCTCSVVTTVRKTTARWEYSTPKKINGWNRKRPSVSNHWDVMVIPLPWSVSHEKFNNIFAVENRLFIIGGWLGQGPLAASDLHILDLDTFKWLSNQTTGDSPGPCNMHTADGFKTSIFVFRGGDGRDYLNDLHELNTEQLKWNKV